MFRTAQAAAADKEEVAARKENHEAEYSSSTEDEALPTGTEAEVAAAWLRAIEEEESDRKVANGVVAQKVHSSDYAEPQSRLKRCCKQRPKAKEDYQLAIPTIGQ